MNPYSILDRTQRQRVSDGAIVPIVTGCESAERLLILLWPQLGDFDSLEYAWWLKKESDKLDSTGLTVRAIGIGDRSSGEKFCQYTGFSPSWLFVDPTGELHQELGLYEGLAGKIPLIPPSANTWLNLLLMCAGIGSPGTLAEVWRGYRGDRSAPQLIGDEETIHAHPLPPLTGSVFAAAGGKGFQRPFELATLRLRNMSEVLGNWRTYVPEAAYMTRRGGTFLFDASRNMVYQYRDRGILGFAENMARPLAFLDR
jgi:hypothetical protein